MHEVLLANQIISEISRIAKAGKLDNIKSVNLEIGSVALAHDSLPGHIDEIDPGNLKFILENVASKYGLEKTKFDIKKIPGNSWKIREIIKKNNSQLTKFLISNKKTISNTP